MSHFDVFAREATTLSIPFKASTDTQLKFNQLTNRHVAGTDAVLLEQNGVADQLNFLISGRARFSKQRRESDDTLGVSEVPFTPLGISGLTSPGRYRSTIAVDAGSDFYVLELARLRDLIHADPEFGTGVLALTLAHATNLVWSARGMKSAPVASGSPASDGSAHSSDRNIAARLSESAFFSPFSEQSLLTLLTYSELRLYSKDEVIAQQGQISNGLYVLFSGRVHATFTDARSVGKDWKSRTVVRPGVALSWNNGYSELASPYTITASRDTSMLVISSENLCRLMREEPIIANILLQQQLWQIGRYQQTAAGLSGIESGDRSAHVEALLQDNGSRIPVESALYSVPHALRNRFTIGYAFDCIYSVLNSGNDAERSVAGLMIDTLEGVQREHRFFNHLTSVYSRVAGASRTMNPATIRELSNADFSRAFDQVAYVIKGMENLPASPTNIFFYNHLAAIPENELANGHSFSIDSHFISAKILLPKYGDSGQRIVRSSRNTEFWRNGYYSRLDNIFVHNAESDWLQETPAEKEIRKEKLFLEAQRTFDAGRPLAIAPEGTSETPDNLTPTSPGPLKPGAFLLAARLNPKPMLVPIALANFDYPVSRTTYAAVIKPPFYISDHVEDVNDRSAMENFLIDYREIFRGYVAEARELAETIQDNLHEVADDIVTNVGLVSPVEEEFEADIRELEASIAETRRASGVALYGSSTFRLWQDAQNDLGRNELVNLGFGGATLTACRAYFKRMVLPHNPGTLVLYAGDNDIGAGSSAAEVAADFAVFMTEVTEFLPHTKCLFISIKPSPFRTQFLDTIQQANQLIETQIATVDNWQYIDLHTPMLNQQGEPSTSFYDEDPLHLNTTGYALLAKLLRDALTGSTASDTH